MPPPLLTLPLDQIYAPVNPKYKQAREQRSTEQVPKSVTIINISSGGGTEKLVDQNSESTWRHVEGEDLQVNWSSQLQGWISTLPSPLLEDQKAATGSTVSITPPLHMLVSAKLRVQALSTFLMGYRFGCEASPARRAPAL